MQRATNVKFGCVSIIIENNGEMIMDEMNGVIESNTVKHVNVFPNSFDSTNLLM